MFLMFQVCVRLEASEGPGEVRGEVAGLAGHHGGGQQVRGDPEAAAGADGAPGAGGGAEDRGAGRGGGGGKEAEHEHERRARRRQK